MRLVFPLMLILLVIVLVGFLITNPSERVTVTVGNTQLTDVALSLVALVALTVGVVFTAIVALVEGAAIRLTNRRLRREVQRLETENGFLRQQTASGGAEEPAPVAVRSVARESQPVATHPASAPVYDPHDDDPTRGE